jgi:hypothetical protein
MQVNKFVGQHCTGMVFNVQAETEEEFVDLKWLLQAFESHDIVSRLYYFWSSNSVNYNNISVSFDPDRSTAKVVKLTAAYGKTSTIASKSLHDRKYLKSPCVGLIPRPRSPTEYQIRLIS